MSNKVFRVRVRCTVTKYVYCENCTEEDARRDPFECAFDEIECDMTDWEVLSVTEVE